MVAVYERGQTGVAGEVAGGGGRGDGVEQGQAGRSAGLPDDEIEAFATTLDRLDANVTLG